MPTAKGSLGCLVESGQDSRHGPRAGRFLKLQLLCRGHPPEILHLQVRHFVILLSSLQPQEQEMYFSLGCQIRTLKNWVLMVFGGLFFRRKVRMRWGGACFFHIYHEDVRAGFTSKRSLYYKHSPCWWCSSLPLFYLYLVVWFCCSPCLCDVEIPFSVRCLYVGAPA